MAKDDFDTDNDPGYGWIWYALNDMVFALLLILNKLLLFVSITT